MVNELMARASVCSLEPGNEEKVLKFTDMAIKRLGKNPDDYRPFLLKGEMLAEQGQLEEARALLQTAKHCYEKNKNSENLSVLDLPKLSPRRAARQRQIMLWGLEIKLDYLAQGKMWKDHKEIVSVMREKYLSDPKNLPPLPKEDEE